MVVTRMKQAKIKCRECDCWSLTCGMKNKKKGEKKGYKTIHTFTKRTEHKTNNNNNNNNMHREITAFLQHV